MRQAAIDTGDPVVDAAWMALSSPWTIEFVDDARLEGLMCDARFIPVHQYDESIALMADEVGGMGDTRFILRRPA